MSLSLEQICILTRCHGLPIRSLRSGVRTLRNNVSRVMCHACPTYINCIAVVAIGSLPDTNAEKRN